MIWGEEWGKRRKTKGRKCFFFLNLQKMHKRALKKNLKPFCQRWVPRHCIKFHRWKKKYNSWKGKKHNYRNQYTSLYIWDSKWPKGSTRMSVYQGWGAGAGCFWFFWAGAGVALRKKKQEPEAGAISQFFDLYWTFFQDRLEGGQWWGYTMCGVRCMIWGHLGVIRGR